MTGKNPLAGFKFFNEVKPDTLDSIARMGKVSEYKASDFIKNRVRSYVSIIHPDDQKMVPHSTRVAQEKSRSGSGEESPQVLGVRC